MNTLYNADLNTKEYLLGGDTEAALNPKYNKSTHNINDKYLYNRSTSSLVKPPELSKNEVAVLECSIWVIKKDYRGETYYNTETKCNYKIIDIGVEPIEYLIPEKPNSYSVLSEGAWRDDFGLWLDIIVRPKRDSLLDSFQWRVNRALDNARNGFDAEDISLLDAYMQLLRDFPATLTDITETIEWPVEL